MDIPKILAVVIQVIIKQEETIKILILLLSMIINSDDIMALNPRNNITKDSASIIKKNCMGIIFWVVLAKKKANISTFLLI